VLVVTHDHRPLGYGDRLIIEDGKIVGRARRCDARAPRGRRSCAMRSAKVGRYAVRRGLSEPIAAGAAAEAAASAKFAADWSSSIGQPSEVEATNKEN